MATSTTLDVRAALRHLRRADTDLADLIAEHGPPAFKRTRNSFSSLGRAIIYQQLAGAAAGTIYRRFLELFPGRRFPSPEALLAVPFETLRGVGLSRAKASYLLDLAARYQDGTIRPRRFSRMSNDELAAMLTQVKGIGQWSVDMFLMFGLCRPNVLPVGDLGIRKGMQRHFGLRKLPEAKKMARLAAPWAPYRSVASWYMWRVVDGG